MEFSPQETTNESIHDKWIVDSGSTVHMTNNVMCLHEHIFEKNIVSMGN